MALDWVLIFVIELSTGIFIGVCVAAAAAANTKVCFPCSRAEVGSADRRGTSAADLLPKSLVPPRCHLWSGHCLFSLTHAYYSQRDKLLASGWSAWWEDTWVCRPRLFILWSVSSPHLCQPLACGCRALSSWSQSAAMLADASSVWSCSNCTPSFSVF